VNPHVLIVYHTSEGQTARIAERIADELRRDELDVDVREVDEAPIPDGYDGVVAGDSIHAVKHSRALVRYLQDHAATLRTKPTALFQVSLTSANPDEAHTDTAHELVRDLLERTDFDPGIIGIFAGALVYTQYGWLKRHVMQAIVRREGGDTDMSHDYDYTDWGAVDHFAADVAAMITARARDDTGAA